MTNLNEANPDGMDPSRLTPPEGAADLHVGDPSASGLGMDPSEYDFSHFYFATGTDAFNMLDPFDAWYQKALVEDCYYLYNQPMRTAPRSRVTVTEALHHKEIKNLLNFASYNYLGMSYRPEVIRAAQEALEKYGLGASGSPILSGTLDLHEEFAKQLARFKNKEAVLLFPTGYSANLGVIAGLMRPGDMVFADQFAHASIVDGIILSKAKPRFFRHNDANDLEKKLRAFDGRKLVIVEGVYSMDGDLANLPDIVQVCKRENARIMIDEAHSTFLFGENGRGLAEQMGVEDEIDIHFGTFSKSLGGIGGFVAGSTKLINYLHAFARSQFFSCALPPAVMGGLIKGLEIAIAEPELRTKLWKNVAYMQERLRSAGIDIGNSQSQVIPVMVRDDKKVFPIVEEMLHAGVYLHPIRYPAVGKHRSRLRISISAAHTQQELEEGARIIQQILSRNGLCK
jgi:glycine C-acetyltransferase